MGQRRKLEDKPWATVIKLTTVGADGRTRDMSMVDRRTFTMWLATIDARRVGEAARPTLEVYQLEAADAVDRYFHAGGAINPNATTGQLDRLSVEVHRRKSTAELLGTLSGALPKTYVETVGRELIAESRGQVPTVAEQDRSLEVKAYLTSKGVPTGLVDRYASTFGKRVKKRYKKETGQLPQAALKMVNGTTREVSYYTEADRPLFDAVWDGYDSDHTLKLSVD